MALTASEQAGRGRATGDGGITLGQLTATFVPFGLLLSVALLGAEVSQNLLLARVRASSWVALALFGAAFCLYLWPGDSPRRRNLWLLFWTFAFLAYLVHFAYSVLGLYGGSLVAVWRSQRPLIAGSNFLVTGWWALDVLLAWLRRAPKWRSVPRTVIHVIILVTFLVSSLVIFGGFVRIPAAVLAAAVVVCLAARLRRRLHPSP